MRLDLQTGVCVYAEYLADIGAHFDHDLRILTVDEPFDDALFVVPPFPRWWRFSNRTRRP